MVGASTGPSTGSRAVEHQANQSMAVGEMLESRASTGWTR